MKLMGYVDWDWLFVMYPLAICIGSQILGLFVTIIYAFVIKLLIKKELTRFESLNSKYDIEELIKKYSGKTNE